MAAILAAIALGLMGGLFKVDGSNNHRRSGGGQRSLSSPGSIGKARLPGRPRVANRLQINGSRHLLLAGPISASEGYQKPRLLRDAFHFW